MAFPATSVSNHMRDNMESSEFLDTMYLDEYAIKRVDTQSTEDSEPDIDLSPSTSPSCSGTPSWRVPEDTSPSVYDVIRFPTINEEADGEDENLVNHVRENAKIPSDSPGSARHAFGDCRPCAWFHKPQGCQNGAECRHCHICPIGEVKIRRKVKLDALKGSHDNMREAGSNAESKEKSNPLEKSSKNPNGKSNINSKAIPRKTNGQGASSPNYLEKFDNDTGLVEFAPEAQSNSGKLPISPPPGLNTASPKVTGIMSVGSVLHASGECRPCAWFHKPAGCENGEECMHCHQCSEGEIKLRRKAKAPTIRHVPLMNKKEMSRDAKWESNNISTASSVEMNLASDSPSAESVAQATPGIISIGSVLHDSENCRPCAWYHKPQGCENGVECRHCHVCPKGEIRIRRKSKVAELKTGRDVEATKEDPRRSEMRTPISPSVQAQAMWETARAQAQSLQAVYRAAMVSSMAQAYLQSSAPSSIGPTSPHQPSQCPPGLWQASTAKTRLAQKQNSAQAKPASSKISLNEPMYVTINALSEPSDGISSVGLCHKRDLTEIL